MTNALDREREAIARIAEGFAERTLTTRGESTHASSVAQTIANLVRQRKEKSFQVVRHGPNVFVNLQSSDGTFSMRAFYAQDYGGIDGARRMAYAFIEGYKEASECSEIKVTQEGF